MIPMLLMQLGEVIFGGVGAGFYGMLLFVLLTVFIAGLMIGRTPEYLGKKIESREMKLVALALLIPPALVLTGTAISLLLGRFGVIIPVLALAGSLVGKRRQASGEGTLPTHGLLFITLLVGALTFIPALALGPVVEHLMLWPR